MGALAKVKIGPITNATAHPIKKIKVNEPLLSFTPLFCLHLAFLPALSLTSPENPCVSGS